MKNDNYEIYRKVRSSIDFFATWNPDEVDNLTSELKITIYNKYKTKSEVLQRDNFECQNATCKGHSKKLTVHHIKFKKNGGEDKPRNCVCVCLSCHNAYHRMKAPLIFANKKNLPAHIRGHAFMVDKKIEINWKKVKAEMKKIRKQHRDEWISIKLEDINVLIKWLFANMEYEED